MDADRIYLDHNATTPLCPEALDAMQAVLRDGFGNPSSTHAEGAAARERVEAARRDVAALLGVPWKILKFLGNGKNTDVSFMYSR